MTPPFALRLSDEAGRLAALRRYGLLDTDPEREFEEIIHLVKGIFGVPMAAISLLDEDRQWFKASVGLDVPSTPKAVAFCDHTIRGHMALAVPDATADPRFSGNPLVLGSPDIRCYLGVPLTTPEGYNIGSLCVIGTEARRFTDKEAEVLGSFGRLVISQMELRSLAHRDALTGALSRRAFEEAVLQARRQGPGPDGPSLLLFDIDHFKAVNDRFGHPAGDAVLRAVADCLCAEIRPTDRFGRLGGEEFGLLLPPAPSGAALSVAERARRRVAALAHPGLDGRSVTVSCGIALWSLGWEGAAGWTAAADESLYAAKRAGRDRVVLAA